jgi:hypothetical protein
VCDHPECSSCSTKCKTARSNGRSRADILKEMKEPWYCAHRPDLEPDPT